MAKANRLALSVLVVLSLAAFAAAQSYTVTDLGQGVAYAINSLGDVLVQTLASTRSSGLLMAASSPCPATGRQFPTSPTGINRQGLAVGASGILSGSSAVLWTAHKPHQLSG